MQTFAVLLSCRRYSLNCTITFETGLLWVPSYDAHCIFRSCQETTFSLNVS